MSVKQRHNPLSSPELAALPPLPPNPSSTLLSMPRLTHSRNASPRQQPITQSSVNLTSPSGLPATHAMPAIDDSLTPQAMHALLEPSPLHRPPLSWSARQAKEKRRKDILQLQRWVQVRKPDFFYLFKY